MPLKPSLERGLKCNNELRTLFTSVKSDADSSDSSPESFASARRLPNDISATVEASFSTVPDRIAESPHSAVRSRRVSIRSSTMCKPTSLVRFSHWLSLRPIDSRHCCHRRASYGLTFIPPWSVISLPLRPAWIHGVGKTQGILRRLRKYAVLFDVRAKHCCGPAVLKPRSLLDAVRFLPFLDLPIQERHTRATVRKGDWRIPLDDYGRTRHHMGVSRPQHPRALGET